MPASIPLDAPKVQSMFIQYLEDNWVPIIDKDIDGSQSLPHRLDSTNPNFGRFQATHCVARTIFFSSTPTLQSTNKGVQDINIKLGCAQPGESVAIFGDALRRLTDQATYLYQSESRYWYDTQPSMTRLAQERATQYDEETVYQKIKEYIKQEQRQKGDFASVHPCPDSPSEVLDENNGLRLAILKPRHPHEQRNEQSAAIAEAGLILASRGSSPRNYPNTIIFAAADHRRVEELKQATRLFLAWDAIEQEHEPLNLDAFKWNQAKLRRKDAEERILALLPEKYIWLLVPNRAIHVDPSTMEDINSNRPERPACSPVAPAAFSTPKSSSSESSPDCACATSSTASPSGAATTSAPKSSSKTLPATSTSLASSTATY